MDTAQNILQVVVALLATLAVVIACAYAARKLLSGTDGANGVIKVLATKPLGSRERLMLVELDAHTVLIGVTQHSISNLLDYEVQRVPEAEATVDFSGSLRTWLEKV